MKKITIIAVLLLACAGIQAQVSDLSLDITAGGLKDAMTSEQRKSVTSLTLTGSMNDSDFYLIRDSMPGLRTLDIKSVKVDTIPAKAFYGSHCWEFTLPVSLKYIGDEAFLNSDPQIFITGAFPRLGSQVIEKDMDLPVFSVSTDNIYCSQEYHNIYSADKKILYFQQGDETSLRDETEIIESRAFDGSSIQTGYYGIGLSSGLKLIKEYAFSNLTLESVNYVQITCLASIPPILEKNAFADERLFEALLLVPSESVDLYIQSNSQWSKFSISGMSLSIANNPEQFITTTRVENGWQINTEKSIQSIRITNSLGVLCSFYKSDDRHIFLSSDKNKRQLYLVKIVFEDGTSESLKLLN